MRTHGWGGSPPRSDEDAVARILAATRRRLEGGAGAIGIADVAKDLNVTRQTVYRYFRSTDDLVRAAALGEVTGFLDALIADAAPRCADDLAGALVDVMATVIDGLDSDRYLRLLLEPGRSSVFAKGVTSPTSVTVAHTLLRRLPVDWAEVGFGGARFDELAEFLLRVLQSFVVDPGTPARTRQELRAYLGRWVGGAIEGARARVG